jgi:hypothetical protein
MKIGCGASPPEAQKGPVSGWVPNERAGRRQKRDEPPCNSSKANAEEKRQVDVPSRNSGTMHERHLQEILDPKKLWTAERSDRNRNEDYTLCRTQAYGRRTHKKTFYEIVNEKIPERIVGSSVSIRQD